MRGGGFIANPILVYVAKKVVVDVATEKRTRIVVGSIIAGIILLFMIPILLVLASNRAVNVQTSVIGLCFNNEEIPEEIGVTNTIFIENMRIDFGEIDNTLSVLETENEDVIFIKSVYYVLSLDENIVLTEGFYNDFVKAFFCLKVEDLEDGTTLEKYIYIDEKEEIYSNLSALVGYEITYEQKKDIDMVYNFVMYGTIPVGMSDFSGIPPEALQDDVFRQLMTEATKYIDYPYVWGGSNPQTSFDCSGYICWVYTKSGVYNLSRTTAQGIYNQCVPISRSEAKAGDLVFFTKTYKTSDPVTHIGIYMGDGRMLHCGSPIGYADIDSSYWSSHFYGFGRLQTRAVN